MSKFQILSGLTIVAWALVIFSGIMGLSSTNALAGIEGVTVLSIKGVENTNVIFLMGFVSFLLMILPVPLIAAEYGMDKLLSAAPFFEDLAVRGALCVVIGMFCIGIAGGLGAMTGFILIALGLAHIGFYVADGGGGVETTLTGSVKSVQGQRANAAPANVQSSINADGSTTTRAMGITVVDRKNYKVSKPSDGAESSTPVGAVAADNGGYDNGGYDNGGYDNDNNRGDYTGSVTALYDYAADGEGELSIREGDVIRVSYKDDQDWWIASLDGQEGLVPAGYCSEVTYD